jgi:hypothetical protein
VTVAPVNCHEGEAFCIFLSIVATWKFEGGPDLYQEFFPHRWSRLTHLHDSTLTCVEPGREDNLCLVLNALYGTKYAPYLFGE